MRHAFLLRMKNNLSAVLEFPAGWCFAFALYLLYAFWAARTKIIFPNLAWNGWGYFCLFLGGKILFPHIARCLPLPGFITRWAPSFFLGGEYVLLCRSLAASLWAMSYLRCTWGFPLIDPQLSQLDQMMGVDWPRILHGTVSGPVYRLLLGAYESIPFQLFFFTVWCAMAGRKDRMYETLWILFGSLVLTIFISGFLPALGPAIALGLMDSFAYVHNQGVADFLAIRDPAIASVTVTNFGGIVAFPSFHTVTALIYIYAFRERGFVFYAAIVLNVLMLISTPAYGDHYIVDLIAGVPVALVSILGVRWFMRRHKVAFITA